MYTLFYKQMFQKHCKDECPSFKYANLLEHVYFLDMMAAASASERTRSFSLTTLLAVRGARLVVVEATERVPTEELEVAASSTTV